MLTIHQTAVLALLLSATAWSYPLVHLDQASNLILRSNDPRPITENGIANSLGVSTTDWWIQFPYHLRLTSFTCSHNQQRRTPSNPGESDDNGAKTQLLKVGPTIDGASLKADITANPKLAQETSVSQGGDRSNKPDANDNDKAEKIEEKIKKQEFKIEQLKKKLKKEEERLVKLQQVINLCLSYSLHM
jgi:hypothetical protein